MEQHKSKKNKGYARAFVTAKTLEGLSMGWTNATYAFFIVAMGYPLWVLLIVNMSFMLTYTLFDPFTGRLGDKYGHRLVYVLGLAVNAAGMAIYGLSTGFWLFVLAEVTVGIGKALCSQALESWLDHSLQDLNHSSLIRARGRKYSRWASIPAGVLGGLIGASIGFQWPWFISAFTFGVATCVCSYMLVQFGNSQLFMSDTEYTEPPSVKASWHKTRNHNQLRYSVLFVAVLAFCMQPLNMYWPEVMKQASGGADWWQGFVWVGVALALARGTEMSKSMINVGRQHFVLSLSCIGLLVLVAALAAYQGWALVAVLAFIAHEVPRGMVDNMLYNYAAPHIGYVGTATMHSIRSAALPLGAFFGLGFFTLWGWIFPNPLSAWLLVPVVLVGFIYYTYQADLT
jgi:MFS family permease